MRRPLTLLDDLRIANPCNVAWVSMTGNERIRHCGQCEKSVFDLSAITEIEAVRLIRDSAVSPCVRIYRRSDGTVITRDSFAGRKLKLRRLLWIAASWMGLAFLMGCRDRGAIAGDICPTTDRTLPTTTKALPSKR